MRRPVAEGGAVGSSTRSLQPLYDLAMLDVQRLGNIGAGLKVLEMLMGHADFRPRNGGKA